MQDRPAHDFPDWRYGTSWDRADEGISCARPHRPRGLAQCSVDCSDAGEAPRPSRRARAGGGRFDVLRRGGTRERPCGPWLVSRLSHQQRAQRRRNLRMQANGWPNAECWRAEFELGVVASTNLTIAFSEMTESRLRSVVNVGSIYGVVAINQRLYDNPALQAPPTMGWSRRRSFTPRRSWRFASCQRAFASTRSPMEA